MKKYKNFLICLLLLLFTTNIAFATENFLTMNSAADLALEHSTTLKKLDNALIILNRTKKDADKSAKDAENRLSTDIALKDYLANNYSTLSPTEKAQVNFLILLRVIMTEDDKFMFKKIQHLSPMTTTYNLNNNRSTRKVTENSIKLSVYEQYNNILKIMDSINIQKNLISNIEKNYKQSQIKLKSGKISKMDYQSIELDYQIENLNLQKMMRNYESAIISLNKLIGEPATKRYPDYVDSYPNPKDTINSFDYYLENALKNRHEITSAQVYYDIKKKEHELAKEVFPYEMNNNHYDTKFYMEEAQDNLSKASINIEIELMNSYKELENLMNNWKAVEDEFKQSQSSYAEIQKKYKSGLLSEKHLTNAEISLSQSQIKLTSIKRDVWIYQLKMDYSCGIGPGISQYNVR
jgi:hypothetical protein